MEKSALLVMDMQKTIVDRIGAESSYLERVKRATDTARSAQIPVLYVVVTFRPGHPEACMRNMTFIRNPTATGWMKGDPGIEVHPDVAPREGDIVITKLRVSAFTGSDLEVILRSLGIERLVLAGIATSGVVLSTVRQAADLDYRLTVLSDLCLDTDPEVHRVLMGKLFPKQATVVTADEWIAGIY